MAEERENSSHSFSLLNENCWENSRKEGRKEKIRGGRSSVSSSSYISKRLSVGSVRRLGWRKTERSIARKKGRQINGLSSNDLRSEEVWSVGGGRVGERSKRGRELHFNGPSAYVKVFGGFQRGKNPGRSPLGIRPSQRNRHFVRIPAIVVPRAPCPAAPIFHSTRCTPSVSRPATLPNSNARPTRAHGYSPFIIFPFSSSSKSSLLHPILAASNRNHRFFTA